MLVSLAILALDLTQSFFGCVFDIIADIYQECLGTVDHSFFHPLYEAVHFVFTFLFEILSRAPWFNGKMMYFQLSGPTMLTRTHSVFNAISMFCNNNVAMVLRELTGFTRH